jgi:hypothetical protein
MKNRASWFVLIAASSVLLLLITAGCASTTNLSSSNLTPRVRKACWVPDSTSPLDGSFNWSDGSNSIDVWKFPRNTNSSEMVLCIDTSKAQLGSQISITIYPKGQTNGTNGVCGSITVDNSTYVYKDDLDPGAGVTLSTGPCPTPTSTSQ